MNHAELVEVYERRRAEAARHGSTAPLAKVYGVVLEELRQLDGRSERVRLVTTAEAAEILSVSAKTVRRWIDGGRFPGAKKTSDNGGGEWRLPVEEVYHAASTVAEATTATPRLWQPEA